MALFFWTMSGAALLFWIGGVLWRGGLSGLMASLGPGAVALFGALHIPAAVVGILLWQWERRAMPTRQRVLLEAGTLYFMLAVLLGIFLNYLLISTMQSVVNPAMPPGAG
jgi:hypothetical protein